MGQPKSLLRAKGSKKRTMNHMDTNKEWVPWVDYLCTVYNCVIAQLDSLVIYTAHFPPNFYATCTHHTNHEQELPCKYTIFGPPGQPQTPIIFVGVACNVILISYMGLTIRKYITHMKVSHDNLSDVFIYQLQDKKCWFGKPESLL